MNIKISEEGIELLNKMEKYYTSRIKYADDDMCKKSDLLSSLYLLTLQDEYFQKENKKLKYAIDNLDIIIRINHDLIDQSLYEKLLEIFNKLYESVKKEGE